MQKKFLQNIPRLLGIKNLASVYLIVSCVSSLLLAPCHSMDLERELREGELRFASNHRRFELLNPEVAAAANTNRQKGFWWECYTGLYKDLSEHFSGLINYVTCFNKETEELEDCCNITGNIFCCPFILPFYFCSLPCVCVHGCCGPMYLGGEDLNTFGEYMISRDRREASLDIPVKPPIVVKKLRKYFHSKDDETEHLLGRNVYLEASKFYHRNPQSL